MLQKLKLIMLFAAVTCMMPVYGQVTVGSDVEPAKAALLDIKSQTADASTNVTSTKGGLGLPRVSLVSLTTLQPFIGTGDAEWNATNQAATKTAHAGLTVYNLNTAAPFRKDIYVWDGAQWGQIGSVVNPERYFYVPSFNIPLPDPSETTEYTFDMYAEYVRQFTKDTNNTTFVSSNASLTKIPSKAAGTLYAANELDYVITYYDTDIIKDVSVTTAGVLKYKVVSQATTPDSFLNVVFVIKN